MNRHRALLVILVGSFCGFLFLVGLSLQKNSRWRWVAYNPDQTKQFWQSHNFAPIDASPEFRARLEAGMQSRIGAWSGRPEQLRRVADLHWKMLMAYSQGDFDRFWTFRVPTGSFQARPGAAAGVAQVLRSQPALATDPLAGMSTDDLRSVLKVAWETTAHTLPVWNVKVASAGGYAMRKRYGACVQCLEGIAIDSIDVKVVGRESSMPSIFDLMKTRENIGVATVDGMLEVTGAEMPSNGQTGDWVVVSSIVKLKSGMAHPIVMLAYWGGPQIGYIPKTIGTPISSLERAILIF